MATAHIELVNFIWENKFTYFHFNFLKRYVSLDVFDSNLKKKVLYKFFKQ